MKNFFNIKSIQGGILDVSENDRRVKVAISQMGSKDFDGDVIDHGAYTKTLSERGPKAKNQIWHLTDHNPSLKSAVGKFSDLYTECEESTPSICRQPDFQSNRSYPS